MEGEITDRDRTALVRAAVARVGNAEMKAALVRTGDPSFQSPKPVTNALNSLRKHRDPAGVVTRPQYRAALPYLAAVLADACLSRTIEVLGDHSDDPTREQLADAVEEVRRSFPDVIIGVMLASVADGDMPASDLCFELATGDERFGLAGVAAPEEPASEGSTRDPAERGTTPEQREARRLRKQKAAEARRRRAEASRKAGEQARRARKERPDAAAGAGDTAPRPSAEREPGVAPQLTRRATLTPAEEAEFDRLDPWSSAVVFAWVPFGSADPDHPELEGKSRRCVVVAGSPGELLVRPGYSDGGMKSRDWRSVPLRHWRTAGFDQPTWIDSETLRVPRPAEGGPVGWLDPEDWNALW